MMDKPMGSTEPHALLEQVLGGLQELLGLVGEGQEREDLMMALEAVTRFSQSMDGSPEDSKPMKADMGIVPQNAGTNKVAQVY